MCSLRVKAKSRVKRTFDVEVAWKAKAPSQVRTRCAFAVGLGFFNCGVKLTMADGFLDCLCAIQIDDVCVFLGFWVFRPRLAHFVVTQISKFLNVSISAYGKLFRLLMGGSIISNPGELCGEHMLFEGIVVGLHTRKAEGNFRGTRNIFRCIATIEPNPKFSFCQT